MKIIIQDKINCLSFENPIVEQNIIGPEWTIKIGVHGKYEQ